MAKKETKKETKPEGEVEEGQSEEKPADPDTAEFDALHDQIKIEEEAEKPAEKEEKKEKDEKEKPHPNTIKYAEYLKKSMGNLYVKEWDNLAIDKRIEKMETIAEFNKKVAEGKPKLIEGKIPKGKADETPPSSKDLLWGIDYAALGKKIHRT